MKFFYYCPKLLLCVLILLMGANAGRAAEPLKLVNDPWPPYTGDGLLNSGLATDLVVTALNLSGYQTQVQFVPWKRALRGTIEGAYDVLLTTTFNEERARRVAYSDPYLTNTVRLIKRSGSLHMYRTLDDLKGLDVVVIDGYLYEPGFDAATNFNKIAGANAVSNLKMLGLMRVDLSVEDELVTRYYLKHDSSLKDLHVAFLPKPLNNKNIHIVIRKSRPDHVKIIASFNEALAEMRLDGTYQRILDRHIKSFQRP